MKNFKSYFLTEQILVMTVIAFFLHLLWEYAQCVPFFIHGKSIPTNSAMLIATFGDIVLTWIAFIATSVISRDFLWIKNKWGKLELISLFLVAIILSVAIELRALNSGRWDYTSLNPVIFDKISIIPILQLLILFPLTFYLTKKIVFNFRFTSTLLFGGKK